MLEPDLAYASSTYRELAARATAMAGTAPLTPAAYRDATGTSRKFVMAILEDLDRRGILRRTDAGHVPGPRAATGLGSSRTMSATETVAVIVLAGGRSSRFGRDKLAEPLDGRPLLDHAIDAARRMATEVLVVVAPGSAPAVPAGVQVVHDAQAFEGPLAGVAAGLGGDPRRHRGRRGRRHAGDRAGGPRATGRGDDGRRCGRRGARGRR